jgi:hypothetical protein
LGESDGEDAVEDAGGEGGADDSQLEEAESSSEEGSEASCFQRGARDRRCSVKAPSNRERGKERAVRDREQNQG